MDHRAGNAERKKKEKNLGNVINRCMYSLFHDDIVNKAHDIFTTTTENGLEFGNLRIAIEFCRLIIARKESTN